VVSSPKANGMRSARRPEPDPVELVQRGLAIDVYAHRGVIRLQIPIERARQIIPTTVGVLEMVDDEQCRLTMGADDLNWLARYLLGLPWKYIVEQPDELTVELRSIGEKLVAAHS
jgi:predicted DNA-binding transcriptional regulator YafY